MTTEKKLHSDPSNLVDLFENSVTQHSSRKWIGYKNGRRGYQWITYREGGQRVDHLRAGLHQLGVVKGDTIGLIINNSIEWPIIAFAAYGLGARLVPMYESELEESWKYIIGNSRIKVLFVKDRYIFQRLRHLIDEVDSLEEIVVIREQGASSMAGLESLGKKNPVNSYKPGNDEIAGLIYTSGTSGNPKGVLLSHGNFTSNISALKKSFPIVTCEDVHFSILPWAHSYGQTSELYFVTGIGASMGLMVSVDAIIEDLMIIKPTILIAVPRIFNKVYTKFHTQFQQKGMIAAKLLEITKNEAKKARNSQKRSILLKVLDRFVFGQIRSKFGGRLRYASTGSATMNPEITHFFFDIGIPIYEGYGLSETSPVISVNSPSSVRVGSVGKPIENVTVVIDKSRVDEQSEDGEIICYGPNVMHGYYNQPEKNQEVLVHHPTLGRGVRTGDRGRIDEDGFLHITGRFKEEYKLENGKYIHPVAIEEDLKLIPWVVNAMVYGEGRKYNVCLVVPDYDLLRNATSIDAGSLDPELLANDLGIKDYVLREIQNELRRRFGGYEIPKKIYLLTEDFSLENGMLTQTMKLKRNAVYQKYRIILESMYDGTIV